MPETKLTLFQIEAQLLALVDFYEQAETEEERTTAQTEIKKYIAQEVRKVDGIAAYIRSCEAHADSAKKETERCRGIETIWRNRERRLKDMVLGVMQEFGEKKFQGRTSTLSRRANGGMRPLEITQPELVPVSHKKVTLVMSVETWAEISPEDMDGIKIEYAPDIAEIRHTLESGEGVPGCRLLDRGEHLRCE